MATTLFASGPFVPSTESNWTLAPSASDLNPSPTIDEWWTNTSFPPSAGVMNPYPFASLNHFTVPVAIQTPPPPRKNGQRTREPRVDHEAAVAAADRLVDHERREQRRRDQRDHVGESLRRSAAPGGGRP